MAVQRKLPTFPLFDNPGFTWHEWFRQLRDIILNWNASTTNQYSTPTTGFSLTINDGTNTLVLTPAGPLATGTVTLPANPIDGQIVTITTTQLIVALTVNANTGQSLSGAVVSRLSATPFKSIAVNSYLQTSNSASWSFKGSTNTWYRI